jgi:Lrp/AsnC family leucine-responsive transcriptional regulator
VSAVDQIDKGIFYAMDANCRISYEALARRFDLSANAIKKRVMKLQEIGIIKRFTVWLSLAMLDAEMFVAFVSTDGSQNDEMLINAIGNNPMVHRIAPLTNENMMVFGEYIGATGLSQLCRFIRSLDGVSDIEIHTLLTDKGSQVDLTKLQLRVLKHLHDDARRSIVELANRSGLTARTIRRVLHQLGADKGSTRAFVFNDRLNPDERASNEPVHFRTLWNWTAGANFYCTARMVYKETKGNPQKLQQWLQNEFPLEHWYTYASASEPILFSTFYIDRIGDFEPIVRKIKRNSNIENLKTMISYPQRHFQSLRELRLMEMYNESA